MDDHERIRRLEDELESLRHRPITILDALDEAVTERIATMPLNMEIGELGTLIAAEKMSSLTWMQDLIREAKRGEGQ